jgi:hypothetical protein
VRVPQGLQAGGGTRRAGPSRRSFNEARLALGGIQGLSDNDRATVIEVLKIGRLRVPVAHSGGLRAAEALAEYAFSWPEFDRWQAVFAAGGTFPARWDGLQVVPAPQTLPATRAAYRLRKWELLLEWLDRLTREAAAFGHYTRQGRRARIVRQEDGRRCPVCDPFNGHEVRHEGDTMPPLHPGCRCVLMAVVPPVARKI